MDNYISVIITAYNRKDFLLDALKSALNQTLDKKYYEIIVIKNYNDEIIDKFIENNNIKSINIDGYHGELLYAGIRESKGNIISFLDDDDLFFNNKLEYVYNLFKNNDDLVYYHNNYIPVNEKNENINFINENIDFNNSCMNIRKDIIDLDKLKKISALTDIFIYLSAIDYDGEIKLDKTKLTYYRVHSSASNFTADNFDDYKNKKIRFLDVSLAELYKFKNIFNNKNVVKHITSYITDLKMDKFLWGFYNERPSNIINFIIHMDRPLKNRTMKLLYYAIVRLKPHYFMRYAIEKRKNDFVRMI